MANGEINMLWLVDTNGYWIVVHSILPKSDSQIRMNEKLTQNGPLKYSAEKVVSFLAEWSLQQLYSVKLLVNLLQGTSTANVYEHNCHNMKIIHALFEAPRTASAGILD